MGKNYYCILTWYKEVLTHCDPPCVNGNCTPAGICVCKKEFFGATCEKGNSRCVKICGDFKGKQLIPGKF